MTSCIAAGGWGRSTSAIPAVPAAWFVTTIAFMSDTSLYQSSPTASSYSRAALNRAVTWQSQLIRA